MKKIKLFDDIRSKHNVKTTILSIILLGAISVVTLLLIFALYIIISSPDFDQELLYSKEATVLYYADGSEMTRFGSENRVLVTYEELPEVLIDAIVATEDSRFFQHTGMDVARFIKATLGQLAGNSAAGGASTLTMQVIKNTYTSSESHGIGGLVRKFTDIYMSIFKLESNYTKEEIIEFYVNSITAGNDGNLNYSRIAGVEQISQYYFGKSVKDLSLAEASIIAGMFQNPTLYNPYRFPERVATRQNTVLKLMVQHGYITEEEKENVQKISVQSLLADHSGEKSSNSAQASIDFVLAEAQEITGHDPYSVPMKIYTTIDPKVQDVLYKLEQGEIYEFPNEKVQEGIAITSIEDGSIVALSGGRNYSAKGTNRAVDISRQPGSTAKILFDYGPYIEYISGSSYNMLLDEQTTYSNGTPIKNANDSYMGLITMRSALVNSRNIPALLTFQKVYKENPDYITNFVHGLGIDYGKDLFEAASIGGFDGVSPLEMSAAYAAYGREGYYIKPYAITKVEVTEIGKTYDNKYEKKQVMGKETAFMITDMLMTATKHGVGGVTVSGTDIASKGGTTTIDKSFTAKLGIPSNSTMDAWNITYSPEYSIALWIGYDTVTSEYYLNSSIGYNIRKAVMKAVGSRVYSKNKHFKKPSTVVEKAVELETFPPQLASDYTPSSLVTYEYFKSGMEPTEVSNRFTKLASPTNGNYTFDGTTLTLSWKQIATPEAIDSAALSKHFNTYYGNYAGKYYNKRLAYNASYIGTLGYQVYRRDANGTLIHLGRTEGSSFSISNPPNGKNTYIIKSSYSIFTNNISDGLAITATTNIDSNVNDIITPPNNPTIDNGETIDIE